MDLSRGRRRSEMPKALRGDVWAGGLPTLQPTRGFGERRKAPPAGSRAEPQLLIISGHYMLHNILCDFVHVYRILESNRNAIRLTKPNRSDHFCRPWCGGGTCPLCPPPSGSAHAVMPRLWKSVDTGLGFYVSRLLTDNKAVKPTDEQLLTKQKKWFILTLSATNVRKKENKEPRKLQVKQTPITNDCLYNSYLYLH